MRKIQKNTILLDKIGMWISGACAIHCSVLPLLLALGVGSGLGWMLSHEVELIFLIASLLIASYSLVEGYLKVHGSINVVLIAIFGFASLIIGHEVHALYLNIILSTFGGISILIAHLLNFKLRSRSCTLVAK